MDIQWSDAAVLAAIVAGVFALTRECVAFLLAIAKDRISERSNLRQIRYRLAQFYMHLAVGAIKSLSSWEAVKRGLEDSGTLCEPIAPTLSVLHVHADPGLEKDVLSMAGEDPDTIMLYFHLRTNIDTAQEILQREERDFGRAEFFFSYPNTRRHLTELVVQAIEALEAVMEPVFEGSPSGKADDRYRTAIDNLKSQLNGFPKLTGEDVRSESFAALRRLEGSDSPE